MKEKASNLCEQKSFFKCLYNMPFLKMYLFVVRHLNQLPALRFKYTMHLAKL